MPMEMVTRLPYDHPYRWDGTLFGGPKLWRPTELATALWLDAEDTSTITLNGATVSQWADKSGNGRNAAQATAASQPTYTAGGLNGKPVLTFDGVNDVMSFQGVHNAQWSIATVGRAAGNNQAFIQFGTANQFGSLFVESSVFTARPTFPPDATAPFVANEIAILSATYGQTTTNIWKNGSIGTPAAQGGVASNATSYIGTLGSLYYLNGFIAETVVTNGVLSTADRQRVEGYLAWKWGLEANLPAGHPYKSLPPTI